MLEGRGGRKVGGEEEALGLSGVRVRFRNKKRTSGVKLRSGEG